MLDREGGLARIARGRRALWTQLYAEHRGRQARSAGEQAGRRTTIPDGSFEELTNDPETEAALQLAAPRRERLHRGRRGTVADDLEQRALADPGRALENEQATVARDRVADGALDRRDLRRALPEQLRRRRSGTGRVTSARESPCSPS